MENKFILSENKENSLMRLY